MIYADANGSLPLLPEVRDYLATRIPAPLYANPNAIHSLGSKIKFGMEKCRRLIADVLGAQPAQVIFTSGASESLATVFHHTLLPVKGNKNIIYTSPIEHAAVQAALEYYHKTWGYQIRHLPVDVDGLVDIAWLEKELTTHAGQTALITVMAANNETGVIQPWEAIRDLAKKYVTPFICDTTQWIGRMPFDFASSGLDFAMASGHKLGALPGSGFLLARDPLSLSPLIWGGGQENGLRGGTQNYLGVETLAIALQTIPEKLKLIENHETWRAEFERALPAEAKVIGFRYPRLPGTILVGFPGLHGQGVQIELESQDIFVTTSSACSDNEPATSKVLRAMKVDDRLGRSVVRISLPLTATQKDYKDVSTALLSAYQKLNKIKAQ
jgi:cysteine desulfurase